MTKGFENRLSQYTGRVNDCLDAVLPPAEAEPRRLHEAMRYATLNGGKRVRPLLIYATGECLDIDNESLDPLAVAVELIHAFSLVHDDLPAMDDDDLRRGRPTVHRAFDEATAILAADALQPLAFQVLAEAESLAPQQKANVIRIISAASGSLGMTGGQSIDLEYEGREIDGDELRRMHSLKTGALLSACVTGAAAIAADISDAQKKQLAEFADDIGLAFQIRDDILDVEGETEQIGKPAGADIRKGKATWPAVFGLDESRAQCDSLLQSGLKAISEFDQRADGLRWLASFIVSRSA